MSDDAFNMSVRKFLKEVGVDLATQDRRRLCARRTPRTRRLMVRMTLTADAVGLVHTVDGEIELP